MAVAQRTGTNMEPWVETWTKTCVMPLLFDFEPRPYLDWHVKQSKMGFFGGVKWGQGNILRI